MFEGRTLLVPLIVALLVILAIFAVRSPLLSRSAQASVSVLVEDAQSGRPLVGLMVTADGALAKTEEDGRAVFTDIRAGLTTFKVSIRDFKDFFQTVTLKRGENEEVVFCLEPSTASVKGRVLDSIDRSPLEGVTVVMGGAVGETDVDGRFTLDDVIIGTPTLRIRKDGYEELSIDVPLVKGIIKDLGDLSLTR